MAVDLDELTELEDSSVFRLDQKNSRPNERVPSFVIGLRFEMNFDLNVISRNTYNILDLLSDIGGIQSILVTFFNLLLRIWNYNHLSNYLVSKLYKYKPRGARGDPSALESFQATKMGNVREYMADIFPCRFSWCRR